MWWRGRSAEDVEPPDALWKQPLISSRLFLVSQGQPTRLATYDARMGAVAAALGIEPYPL